MTTPTQDKIPTGKVERALKLVGTGAKIGTNYLKYYTKKTLSGVDNKEELHNSNAEDIYDSLSQLKGSALKVAQMLSMDKNLLPRAYTQQFALSQYSAPPMSAPLVIRTFQRSNGKSPQEIFDEFSLQSSAAASIGQVHKARIGEHWFAVKIQYPGIADSIQSDLRLVKPMANAMFGLSEKEMKKYFQEVEEKLLEETNYTLELKRSNEMSQQCKHLPNIIFPQYYPEYSSSKVLVMDWMQGLHLKEFLDTNPSQEVKNKIAQALWDFYEFQLHHLKAIHADPHPGNFLFQPDGRVGIIDFGCIKEVPEDFYLHYFPLLIPVIRNNENVVDKLMSNIEIVFPADSMEIKKQLTDAFLAMTALLSRPFESSTFHFTMDFIDSIYAKGEEIYQIPEVKKPTQPRGSKHALYVNRTYFGIYSMMADLNAEINTAPKDWSDKLKNYWNC
ncbi:MAG: ABC1 kinase family protein [Bacteroidota bacterium]|jgi:predicted unusual protein kinase regulating ubiquinone biosynthesis (AarF/ABC1/UbiB family)